MRFQRILVGVDFRQPSLAAAKWAVAQFGAGAAIELAHVLQVPDVPDFLRPLMPALDDRLKAATARPLQGLRGFAETLGAEHLSALTRIGPPVDRLVERARAFEADLVVLGRMTVSGTRGRTVERLIRRLSVPTLVVAGGAKERPRRILAAVDDAGIGPTVVHWAAVLAEYFDAELTLLHVLAKTLLAHEWLSEAGRDGGEGGFLGLSHHGVNAMQQFVELEGFAHIVIDPHRPAAAHVVGRVTSGQHQNGNLLPLTTDFRRDLMPVLFRQHEVEQDQVIRSSAGELDGFLSITGPIDEETLLSETYLEKGAHLGIVLH